MSAFYTQHDDCSFLASPKTAGPWSPEFQHAGPPAALLARQIMNHQPDSGLRLADLRIDILGPVPVARLDITVEMLRSGRSLQLLQATASVQDRPALIARAWRMRTAPTDYPQIPGRRTAEDLAAHPLPDPPAPEQGDAAPQRSTIPGAHIDGYVSAIEWRFSDGGPGKPGPAIAWGRQTIPLLAGEEPTGWQRALVLADSGGGISLPVDPREHRLINCDLHVALDRDPAGEWIRLNSQSIVTPGHGGIVHTELADQSGPLGYGMQTMVAQHM